MKERKGGWERPKRKEASMLNDISYGCWEHGKVKCSSHEHNEYNKKKVYKKFGQNRERKRYPMGEHK